MTNPYKEYVINFTELHMESVWLIPLNRQSKFGLCKSTAIKCVIEPDPQCLGKSLQNTDSLVWRP